MVILDKIKHENAKKNEMHTYLYTIYTTKNFKKFDI